MEILHRHNEKKGMAYVAQDENILAEMTYVMAGPHKMIIDHTEVSPALEGQGVGKKLLEKLVTYARENNLETLSPDRELYFNSPEEVPEEELMTEIQVPIREK